MTSQTVILVTFAVLLVAEEIGRFGAAAMPDLRRAAVNWGLGLANLAIAVAVPLTALAAAFATERGPLHGLGIVTAALPLVLVRSLAAYWLHRLFHAVPWLWRIHRVHHSDRQIDTSTGLRNHPFEAITAAALAGAIVIALAPPPAAVAAVDAALFIAALWQHAALTLSGKPFGWVEQAFITPRLHLVHHAQTRALHDRNFGDFLSIWDRLFGTFAPPVGNPFPVGLAEEDIQATSLPQQLLAPFRP